MKDQPGAWIWDATVHRTLLRGTEQDIHRRGRRQEMGRPGWGEVSDLL